MKLVIANTSIHQDAEGRYSLNDLHRASGGEKKHGPSYWMATQQTQEVIAHFQKESGEIHADKDGKRIFVGWNAEDVRRMTPAMREAIR